MAIFITLNQFIHGLIHQELRKAHQKTLTLYYHSQTTSWFYGNPNDFLILSVRVAEIHQ